MSKHPVPKKKTTKRVTKQRYGAFKTRKLKQLTAIVSLTDCDNCGAKKLNHNTCTKCGTYRGRQVIDMNKKAEKITTIKA
ncbi:50S ribosomal protein L32 [Candidatus Peregrinibacteria bacterium HGW-Peregrinibacteria-1]|jgi:large subunit ribosomal protein L32|nr:MAG: 50S ribosomal protein L32 [Candidatus Peregrinibacteria bacterium HGW-Peregrinibacteria-1]